LYRRLGGRCRCEIIHVRTSDKQLFQFHIQSHSLNDKKMKYNENTCILLNAIDNVTYRNKLYTFSTLLWGVHSSCPLSARYGVIHTEHRARGYISAKILQVWHDTKIIHVTRKCLHPTAIMNKYHEATRKFFIYLSKYCQ
jgi:hypothetical protein